MAYIYHEDSVANDREETEGFGMWSVSDVFYCSYKTTAVR